MIRTPIAIVALTMLVTACGSRGDARAPLRLLPPTPPQLAVTQRGPEAVLRFDSVPPTVMSDDGVLVDLDRIEVLMLAQRYPALTAVVLAQALDIERRERLEAAQQAVAAAQEGAAARAQAAERAAATAAAQAAGEEPPVFADPVVEEEAEAVDPDEILSPEEITIRRLPNSVRDAWRQGEVASGTILETAQHLERAVDELWRYLGMPVAIVDVNRPPRLPDPLVVIEAAEQVARTINYETAFDVNLFAEQAEVITQIPAAEINDHMVGGQVELAHDVLLPADGAVRTRYYFALRTVTTRNRESTVERLVTLAPAAVPQPPTDLVATILRAGVLLQWEAPAADLLGNALATDAVDYFVYRRPASDGPVATTLLTPTALAAPVYLDTEMAWNDRHVYEVRARARPTSLEREEPLLAAPAVAVPVVTEEPGRRRGSAAGETMSPDGPRKESVGAVTPPLRVEDIFPPARVANLAAVRAATRVTLRWDEVPATDLRGYRVYRHAAPAPELPGPVDGLVYADALPALPAVPVDEDEIEPAASANDATAQALAEAADRPPAEPSQEADDEGAAAARRRQLRNQLSEAGWQMLTPVIISEARFIDPVSDPGVTWIYVVEAVDASGNVSLPAAATLEAEEGS